MKLFALTKRNFKEITRDPLTLIFAIILPLFLLFIFQQFDIPSDVYKIENFAPSIIIFGFSFLTLFTATLVSKDRTTSLLARLMASPTKAISFVLSYSIAILPVALIQCLLFFMAALFLNLTFNINIIITIIISLPISLIFIFLGVLIGSITNDKSAPTVSSVVVQLVAFTSGMYFSIEQVGGVIRFISKILPFSYCVDLTRACLNHNLFPNSKAIIIVLGYIILLFISSLFIFKRKMQSDNQ